jgi:hypothetical protein
MILCFQLTGLGGGGGVPEYLRNFSVITFEGGRSRGERMIGEGGEGVRWREDEAREGVCVQEREGPE